MKKIFKIALSFLLVLTLIISCVPARRVKAVDAGKGYLVLVQNSNLSWTAYENMVVEKSEYPMIKVASICKALGFEYIKTSDEKFKIVDGKKYSSFTKYKRTFNCNKGVYYMETAPDMPEGIDANSTEEYKLHYFALNQLVNIKYFEGTNDYSGIIAYSKYRPVEKLPYLNLVYDGNATDTEKINDGRFGIVTLIQRKDHSWYYKRNLIEISPKGNYMISADTISNLLGLEYKVDKNSFSITYNEKSLTFTEGKKSYTYRDTKTKTTKTYEAAYQPYKSDKTGSMLIHFGTLNKLVFSRSYSDKKDMEQMYEYSDIGYKGVVTFSKYFKEDFCPDIIDVFSPDGKRGITDDTEGYIKIGGVNFPLMKEFKTLTVKDYEDGGFSIDTQKISPFYDACKKFDRDYVMQLYFKKGHGTDDPDKVNDETYGASIVYQKNWLFCTYMNTGNMDIMLFQDLTDDNKTYYTLSLNHTTFKQVKGGKQNDYNYIEAEKAFLKIACTAISSEPNALYRAIVDSWSFNETCGIKQVEPELINWNEDNFKMKDKYLTKIGDCNVVYIKGTKNYYIEKAK